MIELVYILRRRDDVAPEDFYRYWLEEHAPKVKSVAKAIGARTYVQSHTLGTPLNAAIIEGRGMAEGFDGITEVWFDSLDAVNAAMSTPAGLEASMLLAEDEARFIDLARSTIFLTEEHTIFEGE